MECVASVFGMKYFTSVQFIIIIFNKHGLRDTEQFIKPPMNRKNNPDLMDAPYLLFLSLERRTLSLESKSPTSV